MHSLTELVFSYWSGDHRSQLANFVCDWQASFPSFKIFDDNDIYPLLRRYAPQYVDTFQSLKIPSAKSDVARLLLLYEMGGLYIDCHFGLRSHAGVKDILRRLDEGPEMVVVDRDRNIAPRPIDEYYFINGVIFARSGCPLVLMCAVQALANLECQRTFERLWGHTYYHIAMLSGPDALTRTLLDPKCVTRSLRTRLRPDYAGKIEVIAEESLPMVRNVHSSYRKDGQHWSERQIKERLFTD
jgi:Glycosyltransferase sugar-binding region containing DXD motif